MIVTGAAGGIGRAAVRRFSSEGATVVAVDLARSDLDGTAAAATAAGSEVMTVTADVTSDRDVARYVAAALDAHGRVDALFNNAGIEGPIASLVDCPADGFDRVMDVNVRGVWLGIKHTGPAIAASGGGAIVNTASMLGLSGIAQMGAYVASKRRHRAHENGCPRVCPARRTRLRGGPCTRGHTHDPCHRGGHEPR